MIRVKELNNELRSLREIESHSALGAASEYVQKDAYEKGETRRYCKHYNYTGGPALRMNYSFSRPISCNGSVALYLEVFLAADRSCGVTPKEVNEWVPSACNKSHLYNCGYIEKKKGRWYTTDMGKRYLDIIYKHFPELQRYPKSH